MALNAFLTVYFLVGCPAERPLENIKNGVSEILLIIAEAIIY